MLLKAHDAVTSIHLGGWPAQRHVNLSLVTGQGKFMTFFALARVNIAPR